ncbi:cytochrome c, partial [Arthrospira platensis SPKY1]|nr:cytochrome c [Arthrospira platensis SPKY1]
MHFFLRRTARAHLRSGLALCLALTAASAWAQPSANPLRAAQIASGEAIAKDRCAVCHGEQGQSVAPDFPRLAGQNASYMHKQLMDFADGRRKSAVMLEKAKQLTSEQMYALGLYYQSLKPAVTLVADAQLAQVGQFV